MRLKKEDAILAFGDSITYGFGVSARESYPSVLAALTGYRVINAGINGETSQQGAARIPRVLETPGIGLILLCLGANDLLQRRPHAKIKSNLKRMIAMAKAENIPVVLMGVPSFEVPERRAVGLYDEIASEEEVDYLPLLLPSVLGERRFNADGVHPTAAGYGAIAEGIAAYLRERGYVEGFSETP